jgi:hypothetical protein
VGDTHAHQEGTEAGTQAQEEERDEEVASRIVSGSYQGERTTATMAVDFKQPLPLLPMNVTQTFFGSAKTPNTSSNNYRAH